MHELALYRTAGGTYVAAVNWRSRWQGELDHDEVWLCETQEEAAEALRGYPPCLHLVGFPPGRQFEGKQARVERDIEARYAQALSEVLAAFGPEVIP